MANFFRGRKRPELVKVVGLRVLRRQPFLHRLVESFDLAAGPGVVAPGVFLFDPQFAESGLEAVSSAAVAGRSGWCRRGRCQSAPRWKALAGADVVEGVDNGVAGDRLARGDREPTEGVIIEPDEDLAVGASPSR